MQLPRFKLIIHSQGEFSFIISNKFFVNNICIVSFQPFCHFENSIIAIAVDASKLFSLSVRFCKIYCCFFISFGFQIFFLRVSTFPLFASLLFHFNSIIHSFVPPPSFFVLWQPSCVYSHISSAAFTGFADTIKSQTSNLCCIMAMHFSLRIADVSLIVFRSLN